MTSQTEERMGFDRSQPSFIGTYEGENKGRKRRIRERGGFKVGDGTAEPTKWCENTHVNLHGYTWDLVSQATTHNQACAWREAGVKGGWSGGGMRRCNPPPFFGKLVFLGTICLSSSTGRELRKPGSYINPTQYGSVLGNWSLPKPSLLFSHDAEGSAEHPQPNLQQGWVGGGGAVFTCVLCQGTELTVHTGL